MNKQSVLFTQHADKLIIGKPIRPKFFIFLFIKVQIKVFLMQ